MNKKYSKSLKQKIVFGFFCIFFGLAFGLIYQFMNLDSIASMSAIALGFGCGNFLIIMGILDEIKELKK